MLVHLDLTTADRWTALIGGFEILHGPVTSAIMTEAGHASGAVGPDDAPVTIEERTVRITKYLARQVIRDWRGIVDDATGEAPAVTPATIDAVMDVYPIFRAFNDKVIDARIRVEREKKSLSTLPSGISGPGPDTAPIVTGPAPTAPAG